MPIMLGEGLRGGRPEKEDSRYRAATSACVSDY